ncbi:hypothetical protein [Bacillus wiedmannii]|nr:hypothetical protein [Bacillus wiedmannii]SCV24424.1 Uncharacterized protein BCRIVMBC126_04132 [Bacillus wiedmannii]
MKQLWKETDGFAVCFFLLHTIELFPKRFSLLVDDFFRLLW